MAKTSAAIRKKEKIGELEQKGKRSGERAAEITFIYVTFFLVSSNLTWHSKLSLMPGQHKILELPTPNVQQSTRLNILYILQVIENFLLIKNIHTHAIYLYSIFPINVHLSVIYPLWLHSTVVKIKWKNSEWQEVKSLCKQNDHTPIKH